MTAPMDRRRFLGTALACGAGAGLPLSLGAMPALAQPGGGYRALVCVFLYGGMDSFDGLIPYDRPSYDAWRAIRQPLLDRYAEAGVQATRRRGALSRLFPTHGTGGRDHALAPQLSPLADLFNAGRLAVVANVGPLEQPTTKAMVDAGTAALPPRLLSHNDQQSLWQTSAPEGARSGWGGRAADALKDLSGKTGSPYWTISTQSSPSFLAGRDSRPPEVGSLTLPETRGTREEEFGSRAVGALLRKHLSRPDDARNLLHRDYAGVQGPSIEIAGELSGLLGSTTQGEVVAQAGGSLATQLATVAKLISLRGQLGASQQVFLCGLGGFDTHKNQAETLPGLQEDIAGAMRAFYDWTVSAGLSQQVTTFTASDFGRTLSPNFDGTDHGWGGHHFVMGGAVRGGRIVGAVPEAALGHGQDFDRGRLIPTISLEQYGAPLAAWLGVPAGEMSAVFPNAGRFDQGAVDLF